jgi:catechol 2,3-dioxygenase-like lactoylglutathione lyase family enzyme
MFRSTLIAIALAASVGAPAIAQTAPQVRVRYIVTDVAPAVAFYSDALGFKVDFQAGPTFAALSRGGVQLLLSPVKGPGGASQAMPDGRTPAPGGWNRLVLNTPDLKADVERLKKAGVHFRNDIVVGLGGDEILIDDPSGNVVELFQPTYDVTARR